MSTRLIFPFAAIVMSSCVAAAAPSLVIDVATGNVLHQEQATQPWYPASVSKLMTTYVALKAVRDGRLTMDTPLLVSGRATHMAPSKMGFRPGTEVTLDNALKILMVKSANDVAITVAEGISGSVEAFADRMNTEAAALGMHESHWVNPNGLPDKRQVTSARDMAILGRALYRDFPEYAGLFSIGALQLGSRIMTNHNGLMGRYPGVDGMKTGFTCAAGFNVVASATRGGRHLIVVILGAPSARDRTAKAANLFDRAFADPSNSNGNLLSLPTTEGDPPDMRGQACARRAKGGSFVSEIEDFSIPIGSFASQSDHNSQHEFMIEAAGVMRPVPLAQVGGLAEKPHFDPIPIFVGRARGWVGLAMGPISGKPKSPNKSLAKLVDSPVETAPASARAFASTKPAVVGGAQKAVLAGPFDMPMQLPGSAAAEKSAKPTKAKAIATTKTAALKGGPSKKFVKSTPKPTNQAAGEE